MAKNISLSDEAYRKLSNAKRPDESFSDIVLRLLGNKKKLSEVIGKKLIASDINFDDIRKASRTTMDRLETESA